MENVTRVGIVDDHPLMLEGIAKTICLCDGFEVVGLGSSLDDALIIAKNRHPAIMLLDVKMPGNGLETARQLVTLYPHLKIIMLTVSERVEDVTTALNVGAKGYLLKGSTGDELCECLQSVRAGQRFITPELAMKVLVGEPREEVPEEPKLQCEKVDVSFTRRELEVVEFLARGMTNREIAVRLSVSEKTIKHYMTILMQKLHVRNRVEAVLMLTQSDFMPGRMVGQTKLH